MGFWISYGPTALDIKLEATLVCKSDPDRKYSLKYNNNIPEYSMFKDPFICCWYIPFETLWNNGSGNKEGKNPNDYYMLEVSQWHGLEEVCWGIRLEYEKEAMSDVNQYSSKMSQASSSNICKYDVFLSFRGEDTRIRTFKDDEQLETGKSISADLLKAIEDARLAVVIFSKSYASSRWCLEELAHIIKCKKELEQIVIPVFYDVSPSDVRHQNPPFADSFSQHKDDMENVQRWRGAFSEAGKINGYHLLNFKDEAECVKKLVDDIFPKSL
ncbi:hypothetical protein H5410_063611 [Solanum commersonii]|uniref:TIR domain-containing protein n=1 Tax=Solanum commersonii TaxID=4109 RepID=A0A9J5WED3_SOLCO|nr:hypothetical protein H5410_063611 [Solanum commersonii]